MKRIRLSALTAAAAAFVAFWIANPKASQRISIAQAAPGTIVVRIDEPIVNQRLTEYRDIRLQPGDQITIDAGGCVQTGGHGRTWKRYVNPSGPNADRLYHGLVWIPGVMGGLLRIQGWMGRPLTVPSGIDPSQLFLRLGYEDDGYGDNSYSAHDDGTEDQCKGPGGGAAWIILTIVRHAPPPPPVKPATFDVVAAALDENGIPLNPRWGSQVPAPGVLPGSGLCGQPWTAPCTTQAPGIDTYFLCSGHGPLGGHANWTPATFEGTVMWNSHSTPGTDDDYNIDLVPVAASGLTNNNADHLHTEFDSDETIDHFGTSWWQQFHDAVDSSDAAARNMIDGKYGVIAGLFGLDCAHACGSELHPVWVLAIRVNDAPDDETWAIFARNWGNEGFCGDEEHYVDLQNIRIRLPWRTGASSVSIAGSEFLTNSSQVTGPSLEPVTSQSVAVVFTLPPPESHARVNGVLHLRWTGTTAVAVAPRTQPAGPATVDAQRTGIASAAISDAGEPEARVAAALAAMPAADRQRLLAAAAPVSRDKDGVALRATIAPPGPPHAIPAARPRVRHTAADPMAAAKRQRKGLVAQALGGRLP